MQGSWINQTVSPKPESHPAVVWTEEVLRAAGKSLLASALSRCLFGSSTDGPSTAQTCGAVLLFLLAGKLCDCMPVLGQPFDDKPYLTFASFWPRYLAEHREP